MRIGRERCSHVGNKSHCPMRNKASQEQNKPAPGPEGVFLDLIGTKICHWLHVSRIKPLAAASISSLAYSNCTLATKACLTWCTAYLLWVLHTRKTSYMYMYITPVMLFCVRCRRKRKIIFFFLSQSPPPADFTPPLFFSWTWYFYSNS